MTDALQIKTNWTKARLMSESGSGYVLLAASSGDWGRLPFAKPSARRREMLGEFRRVADRLLKSSGVLQANVFRGVVRPPGGEGGTDTPGVREDWDVVLFVETSTPETASAIASETVLGNLRRDLPNHFFFYGSNARRIAPVDHRKRGVFLFNFFSARDAQSNLQAWQYTAGWFQDETGLDNSTVILPADGQNTPYTLVNHCRWDHYVDVLPALIFKKSFHSFVLRVFRENDVVPWPILYSLYR